jgi:hypothetical protein
VRRQVPAIIVLVGLALMLEACSSGGPDTTATIPATSSTTSTSSAASGSVSRTDPSGTVWLCRPGLADDPCTSSLAVTSVPGSGARATADPTPASDPPFDCFYVYPTVSNESGANADLTVQPVEVDAAINQASPFSSVCRVWAPMYRQRTAGSLIKGLGADPAADEVAYQSLLAGWTDYLEHDNDGRPIIFIGHSQGSAMLIRLLTSQVDPDPSLRARTVSVIIPGGNVAVPTGRTVGSTFTHLPLCTSTGQTGCVIAYSSYPGQPPADSLFGRPGTGVSLQSDQTAATGVQVACVNPAALAGGTGALQPWFLAATVATPPPAVTTPWVTYPGLYTATCTSAGGATWLEVDPVPGADGGRPLVTETLGPTWGYHLDDINLATGNLVADVRAQERAYTASH